MSNGLTCWIYRSPRTPEMYLYLREEDAFDKAPEELLQRFGPPQRVMELRLHPGRKLAREDVERVMANLREQGYHLQLPPEIQVRLRQGD